MQRSINGARHRSNQASVANNYEVTITNQSNYQQMNMQGDTQSLSEHANSPCEHYQPLASNSSDNQQTARDEIANNHHTGSIDQFGKFQSHISNFEKLARDQLSTSRSGLQDVTVPGHSNQLKNCIKTLNSSSEPSIISKHTEMRSDIEQKNKNQDQINACEDDDNFQQFQMYQPNAVNAKLESADHSSYEQIDFKNIDRNNSTQENSIMKHAEESQQPPAEIHSNQKDSNFQTQNEFQMIDSAPQGDRFNYQIAIKNQDHIQTHSNLEPLPKSIMTNSLNQPNANKGSVQDDQAMYAAIQSQHPMHFQIQNKRLRESYQIEQQNKSEIMNLSRDLVPNQNVNGYLTQNNSHSNGIYLQQQPQQISRQQTNPINVYEKKSYLNIYDGIDQRNHQQQFKKDFNFQRSEDQSTISEITDINVNYPQAQKQVQPVHKEKAGGTRNFNPAKTTQTSNIMNGKTTDTGQDVFSGDRTYDRHAQSNPYKMVTAESKNALQLINDHSSKNFEDFQKTNNGDTSYRFDEEAFSKRDEQIQVSKREPLNNSIYKQFRLFGWGLNDQHQLGQLGLQTLESIQMSPKSNQQQQQPVPMHNILFPRELKEFDQQVKYIVCGLAHSLILTINGQVFGLGENSHGQLGLSVSCNPIVSFPTLSKLNLPIDLIQKQERFEIDQIATSPGNDCHSLLLVSDSSSKQYLLGSGLNSHGQLGFNLQQQFQSTIIEQFIELSSITNMMSANMQYNKIGCGSRFSVICVQTQSGRSQIDSGRQEQIEELLILGDLGQDSDKMNQIVLPRSGLKDMKCSNDHILVLMNDGQTFVLDRALNFEMRPLAFFSQRIVEIAASGSVFAALDFKNVIYRWQTNQSILDKTQANVEKIEYSGTQTSNLLFLRLSLGSQFLHVIDEQGNLYGWGNNKHGELGTGDCFPRPYLSQIRVFNFRKMYLRCKNIFSGHSFALGLFESTEDNIVPGTNVSNVLRNSKSAERDINDSSIISSLTRQLKATNDVINRSQALSKSAAFSGQNNKRKMIDGNYRRESRQNSCNGFERDDAVVMGNHQIQETNNSFQREFEEAGPSPNPLNISKFSEGLTPIPMSSKLADTSPHLQKPPLNPNQSFIRSSGLPASCQTSVAHQKQTPQASNSMNIDLMSQLNKTDQALQKYRRAASNYRENAYRIKVMEEIESGCHENVSSNRRVTDTRYGHGNESKSLPRQGNAYGVAFGELEKKMTTIDVDKQQPAIYKKYSQDHIMKISINKNANFQQAHEKIQVDPRSLPETSNCSKEQLPKNQPEFTQDETYSNFKQKLEIEKVGQGLVPQESNLGSQAASNFEIAGARGLHEYKPSMPETNQKMTITSGSNRDQLYSLQGMNPNDSLTKQSVEMDIGPVSRDGHHRHRSSISMTGPHICGQLNSSDREMDSQRAVMQIDANVDQRKIPNNITDNSQRDKYYNVTNSQPMGSTSFTRQEALRLESEPSINPLSQSYAAAIMVPETTTNQSSKYNFGYSYQKNVFDQSIGNRMHQSCAQHTTKQFIISDASYQINNFKNSLGQFGQNGLSQDQNMLRDTYTRPLRSQSLKPQAQIESSRVTPDRSYRDEMPLQINNSRMDSSCRQQQSMSSNRQYQHYPLPSSSDPTSPDLNLGLMKLPSQIMGQNQQAINDLSVANQSSNEHVTRNQAMAPTTQFKILSKEEWRQEMLKESVPVQRTDRWADSIKFRGRSHEVGVRRDTFFSMQNVDEIVTSALQPGWREMALQYHSNYKQNQAGQQNLQDSDKLQKQNEVLEDATAQFNMATGSFNGSNRLYSQLSMDSQKRRRQEALKNLQERAQQLNLNVEEQQPGSNCRQNYMPNTDSLKIIYERKFGTLGQEQLKSTSGAPGAGLSGTFNHESMNPHLNNNNQSIFGIQLPLHNGLLNGKVQSQSNMGSVMSTASLGHQSKDSHNLGSNSAGRSGLCGSMPRSGGGLNPPTVTSIDILESNANNNTKGSVVVQDQQVDISGKLDSRISSVQIIRRPSIGCSNGRAEADSLQNSKKYHEICSQNRNYKKSHDFEEIRVDLDAYKVSPYTPAELPPIDSAQDSKQNIENIVLDYSAATSQGGDILKRSKNLSRIQGHRMAHSTGGGQDSRTTLTVLSSITQSRCELPEYNGQSTQSNRNKCDYNNLNIELERKHIIGSEQNTIHGNEENNQTNGTSSVHGISISHSTIDNIGIGGGETVHNQQRQGTRISSIPDSYRLDSNVVQLSQVGNENKKVGSKKDESKNKAFQALQEKLTTCKQKLNKYKKKLKKYIANNAELQRDVDIQKEQNKRLQEQNSTLMKCDEQKEDVTRVLQDQLGTVEKQMMAMRGSYEDQIKQLSEENFSMLSELQERDEKQRILQEKLEYVECEIESIGMQLKEQSDINQLLREQMALQQEQQNQKSERRTRDKSEQRDKQNHEIQCLKNENEKLKEQQKTMQQEYELMKRRLFELEKKQISPELTSQETEIIPNQAHITFKSHEYLNAIGQNSVASIFDQGSKLSKQSINQKQKMTKLNPSQIIEDVQLMQQDKHQILKPNTVQASPAAGMDKGQNRFSNFNNDNNSVNKELGVAPASSDYYAGAESQAQNSKTNLSRGSKGSRRGEKSRGNASISFQKSSQINSKKDNEDMQSEMTRNVYHKQHLLSQHNGKHDRLINDSFSGHQHTFSQVTQHTNKTQQSQMTAMTRDVQYNFRQDLMAVGIERINVQSNSNIDEPDITDHSQIHTLRSSRCNPKSTRRSEDYPMPQQKFNRNQKQQFQNDAYENRRQNPNRSEDSNLDIRVSREGVKSSSRINDRFEIDQINQSTIPIVDESTSKIEQQLNDQLSLEASLQQQKEQDLGQRLHLFGRSKSVPPDMDSGSFPHEISMAQLNHAQAPAGAVNNCQIQNDENVNDSKILFKAYPRDNYPNYDYVQKRYLQNQTAQTDMDQIKQFKEQQQDKMSQNMPLMMSKSPNSITEQTILTLNHDSASESEIEMLNRLHHIKGQQVAAFLPQDTNSTSSAFKSKLPHINHSTSRSGDRNSKTLQTKENQSSRTKVGQNKDKSSSRIGKGIEKSYLEKFSQLSISQQEQLINFVNQNGNFISNQPLQQQHIKSMEQASSSHTTEDKYAHIVQKIERIEQQASRHTLTVQAGRNESSDYINANHADSVINSINNVPLSPTSQVAMSQISKNQNHDVSKYEIDTRNFVGKTCIGQSSRKDIANNEDWISRVNRPIDQKRPISHLTDDSLEPIRESKDKGLVNEDQNNGPIEEERIIDYRDAILSKFAKRTNERIVQEKIVRDREHSKQSRFRNNNDQSRKDLHRDNSSKSFERAESNDYRGLQRHQTADSKYSKSVDDMTTIENRAPPKITTHLENKSRSINLERFQRPQDTQVQTNLTNVRQQRGTYINSLDRLNQISAEKSNTRDNLNPIIIRDRSRDSNNQEQNNGRKEDIAQKYKDAFKNLSQELKKKMHDKSQSKKQETDEEGYDGSLAQPSKSQDSFVDNFDRNGRHQQTDSIKHEKQLSMKYLQATNSVAAEKNHFQTNVSNESFGPTKSAVSSFANKASNMKQLGNLMKVLQLDDSRPLHRTSSLSKGKNE